MNTHAIKRYIVALAIALLAVNAQAQSSPNSVIEDAAKLLDDSLKGRKEELAKDKKQLYQLIDDILLPRFDRTYAAQLVLGPHWKSASGDQRKQFIDAFYQNLLRKYSDGVLEYDAGRIEILPFRGDLSKPRVTVRTAVRLDDGTKVPVDYSLVKRNAGWLLFDVSIEGISYVRNFRAELNAEINSSSLDAVINRLQSEAGIGVTE
ncbi:MAG: ABC transporter substrate-binding protein [Gammaproteobacteria bacterium]|nr:ABC transporter substrate-binding protein [Gammaproteobacteria bacterium]MDH4315509.1 ABC transporter substrate-binding protein [Gammaproteobacteria bacterium]MDH5214294.1 ABC transporter substrate-binding protein [Gammaproteobacteria bacterium]MDH5500233.1 ABC transporter substrate-binding protein [Gammaproteobacteria bacterium]